MLIAVINLCRNWKSIWTNGCLLSIQIASFIVLQWSFDFKSVQEFRLFSYYRGTPWRLHRYTLIYSIGKAFIHNMEAPALIPSTIKCALSMTNDEHHVGSTRKPLLIRHRIRIYIMEITFCVAPSVSLNWATINYMKFYELMTLSQAAHFSSQFAIVVCFASVP